MSPSYHPSFFSKILPHFNIKYHVAVNLLIPRWYLIFVAFEYIKSNAYVTHFFVYSLPPQFIVIDSVKFYRFCNSFWKSYTKFVRSSPVFRLYFGDNEIPLFDNKGNPPRKFWIFCNTSLDREISEINWVTLFDVFECFSCGASIFPKK